MPAKKQGQACARSIREHLSLEFASLSLARHKSLDFDCHSERSEESRLFQIHQTFHFVQGDI